MRMRGKFLTVLLITVFMGLLVSGCGGSGDTGAEDKTIRIGVNNWAENIAVANMWKLILEEQGYKVELFDGEKAIIYTGVSKGDMDLGLEVWLPYTDEPYWNEYKDGLDKIGPWYEGTGLGLVVPAYMDINSIEELNSNKDKFKQDGSPSIIGIDPGASLMALTKNAVTEYGLDYKLIEGSETMMLAALKNAYDKKEPILVTLWNPHWVFADYDLKYLEDPKNVFGDDEKIYVMARKGFDEKYPDVTRWLNQWKMDDQSLGNLMATINDAKNPAEGAKAWLETNQDMVKEWLK